MTVIGDTPASGPIGDVTAREAAAGNAAAAPGNASAGDGAPVGDPFDARLAKDASGVLRAFNDLGVISGADIHVAWCLAALADPSGARWPAGAPEGLAESGESRNDGPGGCAPARAGVDGVDGVVVLAAALAVRAPRLGHVCTDLATARDTTTSDAESPTDVRALPWPNPETWLRQVAASPLVATGDVGSVDRPLRLVGSRLYLDRYWRQERQVAAELRARSQEASEGVDVGLLAAGLDRLFGGLSPPVPPDSTTSPRAATGPPDATWSPDATGRPDAGTPADAGPDLQRLASAAAVLRRVSVIAGGPGTGKTTIVARVLALLDEQAAARGLPAPRIALAAPTGKAAGRLEEAVHAEAASLAVDAAIRDRLLSHSASTIHRLLGWRPGSHSRFRHDHTNRLPYDVVIIDETSMVSLSLVAKLIDAVRADARMVLVGDPEQLASVEAGAVLGDIVGPAAHGLRMRPPARRALARATGQPVPAADLPSGTSIGDGIVVLRRVHRYGGGIAALAAAVQAGNVEASLQLLERGAEDVRWVDADVADPAAAAALSPIRAEVVQVGRQLTAAASAGDIYEALSALGSLRVLCAHREGPHGVATWATRIERWLAADVGGHPGGGAWYVGRPLLITENDYELQLFNGDTGVVASMAGGRVAVVFERRGEFIEVSPTRLGTVETVRAMTVHKSQGSQFCAVILLLPHATSPILTRQLLYTAITRARRHVTIVGPAASVRAAVGRPIARASGLGDRLWT